MQMLHSEQIQDTSETAQEPEPQTSVVTEQAVHEHSQVSIISSSQHKKLIYATESFEQFEEETVPLSEKSQIFEEPAAFHTTEVPETDTATTHAFEKAEVWEPPTYSEPETETERTEQFVTEDKEITSRESSLHEETATTEPTPPVVPETETERTEQFITEEKETTTHELLSKKTEDEAAAEPETSEEESEKTQLSRLTYMAFDNMGFTEEDVSAQGQREVRHQLSKQETREISPEDLEEKPYTFDFPDDFKQELEAQNQYESTYTEAVAFHPEEYATGREQAEYSQDDDEEVEGGTVYPQQTGDVVLSYEATAEDSGTYLIEVEEKEAPPEDVPEPSKSLTEGTQPPAQTAQDEQPASAEVSAPSGITEASSESSSDNEVEVYDEATGTYIKMPWEIAHQYKRQFSESYLHQEKKLSSMQQNKSIDLGTFYRRGDNADEPSVSFLDELEEAEEEEQPKKTKVTFDLGDEATTHEYKRHEVDEEVVREEDTEEMARVLEPHEDIEYAHEEAVITTILESRQQVRQALARDTGFDSDYLDTPLSAGGATAASITSHFDSAMFQSAAEEMASSYTTAQSSLEQSVDRKLSSETEEEMAVLMPQPSEPVISVVSKESRLAQQELLQEMADEDDRSVSPSRDSEELPPSFKSQIELQGAIIEEPEPESQTAGTQVPTSFPMAVHTLGKALADNEVYESSETERDSTEEKLSPIDEGPPIDDIEDDDTPAKLIPAEKRVTFQTDTLSTPRASEQSADEFKMSTSSSEMSVEPTLLAASYELDTGRVCHVVSAYDISPDSVEQKLTPTAPSKAILSSPEDDVFETDATLLLRPQKTDTTTKSDSDELTVTRDLSSDFFPSPPVSTPRNGGAVDTHTASDLAEASSVLEHMKAETTEDDDQDAGHTLDESTVHEEDELSSPFEMMSPSELKDATEPIADSLFDQMVASVDSAASGGSFAEIQASDLKEDLVITNGPTEVDYVAEYDADVVKDETAAVDADVKEQLEQAMESETEETEQKGDEEESGAAAPVWATGEEKAPSGAEATLSELHLPAGVDVNLMTMSDQTLYGLEMPSEETVTMSASLQREMMMKSETDQDSDHTRPPTEVTFQTDEQASDQVETSAEMRTSALFEEDEVTSAEATPVAAVPEQQRVLEGREDESEQEEVAAEEFEEPAVPPFESPLPEEAEEQPYQLDPGSVYPGKRALEIQIPVDIDSNLDQRHFAEEEQEAGEFSRDAYEEEPAQEQRLEEELDVEDENLLGEAAGGEEEFMEQEAEEMEYMEKPEEELLRLKDSKPESEDEDEGDEAQQQAESGQTVGLLGVQGYDDLERPLSPTPDAFRQTFFGGEDDKGIESPAQSGAEEDIEQTASHFVEAILEDVKEKVQTMSSEKAAEKEEAKAGEEEEEEEEVYEEAAVEEDRELEIEESEEEDLPEAEQQKDESDDDEIMPMPPSRTQQTKTTVLMKQVSEDIPGITITEHLSGADIAEIEDEVVDETDFPISPEEDLHGQCVPEEEEEEDQKKVQTTDRVDGGKPEELHFVEQSVDTEMQFEMTFEVAEAKTEPKTTTSDDSFLGESDPTSAHTFASVAPLPLRDVFSASSSKVEAEDGSDEEEFEPMEADIKHEYAEPLSPEDHGDSSSVDSFATVVAADAEEEDEDEDEENVEDRLAEIASMSSSFHSDMQTTQAEMEERFEESEEDEAKMVSSQEWPKQAAATKDPELSSSAESERYDSKDAELSSSVESDRYGGKENELSSSVESDRYGSNVELSSSVESDRYEFVDRAALSVITELSEEEQFEIIDKDDIGNETGPESDPQEQFQCSPPEGISQSPGFGATRYFTKPLNERDDASVSSSLLEFERLEKQMGNSGSSSIDTSDKESLGGSYDERKHHHFPGSSYEEKKIEYGSFDEKKLLRYKREMERDDISTTSSLSEFEKLERQIDQQGSNSSVEDKFTAESKSSGGKSGSGSGSGSVAGSASSLAEFEKLEAEITADTDDRRSSLDSSLQRRSETSSLASLSEFERLERDMVVSNEVEAEAQKIVSFLEAGSLESGPMFGYSSSVGYSSSDLSEGEGAKHEPDKDSLDGRDAVEHDSLSEGDDKDGEQDSLDGDTSEMTEMTSSVIYTGLEPPAAQAGAPQDMDADSLAGECIMQLSSDSLTLNQQMRTSDSSKFDTDSLQEQDDIMVRSVDSLEQERHSDKCELDSLQEDVMQTSADSLELVQVEEQAPENLMLMSVESAHWSMGSSGGTMCRSEESHTDSHDFMQVSADSIEDMKSSHTEQTLKSELYTEQTIKSEIIQTSEFKQEGASIQVMHCASSSSSSSSSTKLAKAHPTNPFLDDEGNVMESSGYSDEDEDEEEEKESPFMYWGPYKEEKKVYTMAEWEAMKREKRREREEGSSSTSPQPAEGEPGGTLNIVLTYYYWLWRLPFLTSSASR